MQFERVSSLDDDARALWHATPPQLSPFGFPGFYEAWQRAFAGSRTGFFVVGRRNRRAELVVPMWHPRQHPEQWFSLGTFRADYTEVAQLSESEDVGLQFWAWLARRAGCATAKLARLRAGSLLDRTAPVRLRQRLASAAETIALRRSARYVNLTTAHEHPYADRARLAELAERIQSKDTRRKLNTLAKIGPVSYTLARGDAIAPLLPAFFAMHIANFAGTGRSSQFVDAPERAFYEALVGHPQLAQTVCMDVLRVGEQPAAMHLGFETPQRIYWYKPAFELSLEKGSPGRVLLAHLFARAHAAGKLEVDLLKGNEAYKADWSNHSHQTTTASLVSRSLRDLVGGIIGRLQRGTP